MTVIELRNQCNRDIKIGNGNLQVVIIDPIRANDFFNRITIEKPLTTIEDSQIVDFGNAKALELKI